MRYELSDYEWTVIKPMLPNKRVCPKGAWATIPSKRNRKARSASARIRIARNLVEPFFNEIKECRRVATRYGRLAANYLPFVQLVSIRIWLRAHESTPLDFEACGARPSESRPFSSLAVLKSPLPGRAIDVLQIAQ